MIAVKANAITAGSCRTRHSRHTTIVADVIGVDRKHGLLKVKDPQGNVVEARVRHPELLDSVKEGDQLTLEYTEAVALSVTRGP